MNMATSYVIELLGDLLEHYDILTFSKGIILYTGEHPASFGDNLWAVPFGLLWS